MPINWQDGSSGGTPLSAANLNRLAVVADITTAGTPTGDAVKAAAAAQVTDAAVAQQVSSGANTQAALRTTFVTSFVANAKTYGTNTADATAHIQGLINAATAAGGGTVYIPAGTYKMTGTLLLPKTFDGSADAQVNLVGAGRDSTVLQWASDLGAGNYGIAYTFDPWGANDAESYGTITALRLTGPSLTTALGGNPALMSGLVLAARRSLRDVMITGFYAGIDVAGDHTAHERVVVLYCRYGLYFRKPNPYLYGAQRFLFCDFSNNTVAGIAASPDAGMDNCTFQGGWVAFQPYALYREPGNNAAASNFALRCHFLKIGFEGIGNAVLYDRSGNGWVQETTFDSCYAAIDPPHNWTSGPSDALFRFCNAQKVKILSPQGAWTPGSVATFYAQAFLSQFYVEDPLGQLCAQANTATKDLFAGAVNNLIEVVDPGAWRARVWGLRDGTIAVGDTVSILDALVRDGQWDGLPAGVAMTAASGTQTHVVVAYDGQVSVNCDASVTSRNKYLKVSTTAGKAAAAISPVEGASIGIAVSTGSGTAQVLLRIAGGPPGGDLSSEFPGGVAVQNAAAYTIQAGDAGKLLCYDVNTTNAVWTLPAGVPDGYTVTVVPTWTGMVQVTSAGSAGGNGIRTPAGVVATVTSKVSSGAMKFVLAPGGRWLLLPYGDTYVTP